MADRPEPLGCESFVMRETILHTAPPFPRLTSEKGEIDSKILGGTETDSVFCLRVSSYIVSRLAIRGEREEVA